MKWTMFTKIIINRISRETLIPIKTGTWIKMMDKAKITTKILIIKVRDLYKIKDSHPSKANKTIIKFILRIHLTGMNNPHNLFKINKTSRLPSKMMVTKTSNNKIITHNQIEITQRTLSHRIILVMHPSILLITIKCLKPIILTPGSMTACKVINKA